jgi:hypothetical protein
MSDGAAGCEGRRPKTSKRGRTCGRAAVRYGDLSAAGEASSANPCQQSAGCRPALRIAQKCRSFELPALNQGVDL